MDALGAFEFATPSIVFGSLSSRTVGRRVRDLGGWRVLVMTEKGVRAAGLLDGVESSLRDAGLTVSVFDGVSTEPTYDSVHAGVRFAREGDYDTIVALGGGSTIDSSRATSFLVANDGQFSDFVDGSVQRETRLGPRLVAMATTSGTGSDMTRGAGAIDPETGIKSWLVGGPRSTMAICDPELTKSVPPHVTAWTGTDALTQAIESYTRRRPKPMADVLNLEAIGVIGKSLRAAVANGDDMTARTAMMYAASCLVGVGFGNGGLHAIHPIAQLVGDRYRIPHGRSLGVMLPYVLEFQMNGCVDRLGDVAAALGEDVDGLSPRAAAERGIAAVRTLLEDIGVLEPLRTFGAKEAELVKLAQSQGASPFKDMSSWPRPVRTPDELLGIFRKAL